MGLFQSSPITCFWSSLHGGHKIITFPIYVSLDKTLAKEYSRPSHFTICSMLNIFHILLQFNCFVGTALYISSEILNINLQLCKDVKQNYLWLTEHRQSSGINVLVFVFKFY